MKKQLLAIGSGALRVVHSRVFSRVLAVFCIAFVLSMSASAHAAFDIVAYDPEDGITFTPGALVAPIVAGVVAAVSSGAVLFVIARGVRWIWRMLSTK